MSESIHPTLGRAGRVLRLVQWASIAYVLFAAVEIIGTIAAAISTVQDAADPSRGVSFDFDARYEVPQQTNAEFAGSAYVLPGSTLIFTHASGTVAGLPAGAIVTQAIAQSLLALTGGAIAACIAMLVARVLVGSPFVHAAARTLVVLAVVVMVGFEASSVLAVIARSMAGGIAYQTGSDPSSPSYDVLMSGGGSGIDIDLVPIYVGLALLGLAAVFRFGTTLQADVQRLEKDTEGLV